MIRNNPDIPRYSAFKRSQEKKDQDEEEEEELSGIHVCTSCHSMRGSQGREWLNLWKRITTLLMLL